MSSKIFTVLSEIINPRQCTSFEVARNQISNKNLLDKILELNFGVRSRPRVERFHFLKKRTKIIKDKSENGILQ